MSTTVLYMSMSVDGFIAGPNETRENGLGDGGSRLHEWVFGSEEPADRAGRPQEWFGEHGMHTGGSVNHRLRGPDREVFEEFMSTGAVLAGRGTFEAADGWGGDHHDGVPIFILSRHPAPAEFADYPRVSYVSDLAAAVRDAKAAAGESKVLVHGAGVAQRMLRAGLLDEIQLHLIPVLLGQGRRLFDELPPEQVELHLVREARGVEAMHLRYHVETRPNRD